MDWRNNQWVGIGAAVLLVLGIVVIFFWSTSNPTARSERIQFPFICESTGDTFSVGEDEVEGDIELWDMYMQDAGTAVECRVCGAQDAKKAFYCTECDAWYALKAGTDFAEVLVCPKGHARPGL